MGVKILCLNVLRTFKKKKLQLAAIGVIIFLSSFLYTTMFYTMDSMTQSMEKVIELGYQEDFSIEMIDAVLPNEMKYLTQADKEIYQGYTLTDLKRGNQTIYRTLMNKREDAFLKKYPGYELEIRNYKDVDFNDIGKGHTLRFYKDAKTINKTYVESGRKPQSRSEIALTRVYAQKNNFEIGESIEIKGKAYTIVGFITFPDMTCPILGSDFIIDTGKISTGLVFDREYEKLKGEEYIYFAGKADNAESLIDFKQKVIDDIENHESLDFITSIIPTKNQMRSGAIYEELKTGKVMTLGLSMIISSIAVMIVAILVAKILKNERVQIGVLKAIGYSRAEVAFPYMLLLFMIGFPSLFLGYVVGRLSASPLKAFYLDFYLLPNEPIVFSWEASIVAIGVPLIVIIGLSCYIIIQLLSKDTIKLLKVGQDEKVTKLNKLVIKLLGKAKAQTKYKYSFIFKNVGKFLVFFWGMSFSSMLILLSLMMVGFFDKMTLEAYETTAYSYEGHIDITKSKPRVKTGQEKFLTVPNGFYQGEYITSIGLSHDNKLHKIYDKNKVDITERLQEGLIVNKSFDMTYDIDIGDMLEIEIGNKVYQAPIVAISKDYGDCSIYWEIEALSEAATQNRSKKLYTGVYSTTPLDEDDYAVVVSKADIMEQAVLMQGLIQVCMYAMIASAAFISILILYILTSLTVEDNYYNISLLKVMGYNQKEVNNMILNSYLVYGIIMYLAILPLIIFGVDFMVDYFSKSFGVVMPLEFEMWHSVVGLALIISIFSIGAYSAKKRIKKVPLQEILKAYRE
ncbi:MAG: ABC transporter permease [Cellulosilyticaceae bacterium]